MSPGTAVRTALLLAFACVLPAPSGITVHATPTVTQFWWSTPDSNGILVLVTDDNTETSHFHITVEYLTPVGPTWDSRIVAKVVGGFSAAIFSSDKGIAKLVRVKVLAMKVTGYREADF